MNKKDIFRLIIWAGISLAISALIFAGGCGKSGTVGFPDTDYLIDSVWADYSTLIAGDETNVYALVVGTETGNPVPDAPVEFTTNYGTIENQKVLTNSSGIATTVFQTEQDSTANYTATIIVKVTAEQIRTKRLYITVLPTNYTDPAYIYFVAEPDTVYADGTSQIDLTATVLDASYSGLQNHKVLFNFIEGNLGDIILTVDNYAITDADGIVTGHFIAPNTGRLVVMSATVQGIYDSVSAVDSIWILEIPDVDFIDLRADPTSIPADGNSETELSAYVTVGATGTPAPDGTEILFTAEDGTLLPIEAYKSAPAEEVGRGRIAPNSKKTSPAMAALRHPAALTFKRRPAVSMVAYTVDGYARLRLRSSTTAHKVELTASAAVGTTGTIADTAYVTFTAGDPISVVVDAARTVINADGHDTTLITATVYDEYGNTCNTGWTVDFATDKGTVFPASALTDTAGRATTVLTSGVTTGYARVTATCEGASGYTEVLLTSTIPKYIQLNALPNQLPADGLSQSIITAEVLDSLYNPVTDGVRIKFFTDLGTLSSSRVRQRSLLDKGKGNFTADSREATTSGGFCSVILTSGYLADSCMVAAWYQMFDTLLADTVITATDTIYIPFLPGEPSRIDVSFSRDSILADNQDTCTVWADVFDAYDNPVGAGIQVTFSTDEDGGSVNPVSDNTDATGRAQTELTSSRNTGWHTITATASGATPGHGQIYFYPILPKELRVLADFDSATADGADQCTILVYITDDYDRPCSDGTPVTFRTDMGTFMPLARRTALFTGDGGDIGVIERISEEKDIAESAPRARVDPRSLMGGGSPAYDMAPFYDEFTTYTGEGSLLPGYAGVLLIAPTTIGTTWVYVSVVTGVADSAVDSMQVAFMPDVPMRIELTATPDTIPADSASSSIIEAYLTDAHFNPVGEGHLVEFSMVPGSEDFGHLTLETQITNAASICSTKFKSHYTTGEAVINAKLISDPDVTQNVSVWLTGALAGDIVLSIDSTTLDFESRMGVTAEVFDSIGAPITDGTIVNFTVEPVGYGEVVPAHPITSGGVATAEFRADTFAGDCDIIATVGSVADTKTVYIGPGAAGEIVLTTDSLHVHIGKTMGVKAQVYDSLGDPIRDGARVHFTVDLPEIGFVDPASPTTTDGQALATFHPDTIAGRGVIIATCDAVADTKTITVGPGPVATIILTATPDTLLSAGGERSEIVAECYDAFGNHAESGRDVTFEAIPDTMGNVISPMATDSLGVARTTYTGGTIVGRVVIRASIDGAVETVPIEIISTGPAYIIIYTDDIEITVGGNTVVHASVFDAGGRPVSDDTQVDFTASRGTLVPGFGFTVGGEASAELHATTAALVDTIIASADSGMIADTAFVHYVADCPVYIEVDVDPDSIFADGRARSTITATVRDVYLNYARPGTPILFDFDPGITIVPGLISTPAIVDSQGEAHTIYRASNVVGTAAMIAKYVNGPYGNYPADEITAQALFDVEQIEPIAAYITVTANPNRVVANGTDSTVVKARVLNEYAEPVADGTVVRFWNRDIYTGLPVGDMDTFAVTAGGDASITWRAPEIVTKAVVYGDVYGLSDSSIVEFIAGDVARVTVQVTPDSVPADGISTADVIATVYDAYDNPVSGVEVTFSAAPFGSFAVTVGNTDSLGQVTTEIYSDVIGVTWVSASAEDEGGTVYTDYDDVCFTTIVAAEIYLSSDTASLVADGISTTTIRAFVSDSSGFSVPDNTPIRFSTDLGFVFPGIGYTVDGEATTTLRSATTVGTATITGDAGDSVTGTCTVDFVPGPPATITLTAIPSSIPADGDTYTTIQAVVYDLNDNLVGAGEKINFSTTLGTIDSAAYTNSLGEATVRLYSGITPGTAVVWGVSGTAIGQTTVDLTNTQADDMFLYVDPVEIVADGYSTADVSGRVVNDLGGPISDGSPVVLSVTTDSLGPYGHMMPRTAHTDSGWFYATFTADRNAGTAYIIAEASPTVIESVMIELIPGPPDSIYIEASDTIIPADSFSTSDIHVEIFDRYDNPVDAGVTVGFDANKGTIDPTTETTNSFGHANALFTSGRVPGEARVRVSAEEAHNEIYLILTNSDVRYISVTTDTSAIVADALSSTFVRAYVTDSLGMPISDGTPVYFSIDTVSGLPDDTAKAFISPTVGFTTDGEAVVQIRSATETGRIWVQACTDSTNCANTFLDLIAGPVDSIEAWADDAAIPANGEAFTIVHARLYDRYGNSVGAGIEVRFETTAGSITPNVTYTNSSGQADAVLTAGVVPTIARIDIEAEGRHAVVQVNLDIAPPAYLSLRAEPRRIPADGESYSTVTAKVLNELGQPINDGTLVIFHSVDGGGADFGSIDTLATTTDGEAVVRLYSEPNTGTAYVSARVADSLSDTVQVIFTPGPPFSVTMQAIPNVLYANGSSICTVRTWVYDEYSNLVESGERINFVVGPESELGTMFPTYTFTDITGPSDVTFQAGVGVGRAVITGTCESGPAGYTMIDLIPLTVGAIDLFTDSMSLIADGVSQTIVHALVLDTSGVGVSDSTPIFFTTSAGNIFPGVAYTTSGAAEVTLRASSDVDTAMVIGYVGDPTDTYYVSDTVYVSFRAGEPYLIEIIPDSASLIADGASRTDINAYVFDPMGNRVAPGHLVYFSTTLGNIDTIAVTEIIAGTTGVAITSLQSGIVPGTALITATSGEAVDVGRVDFIPANVDEMFITIDPSLLVADGRSSAEVSGMVRNSLGNPITDGTPVHIYVIPDTSGIDLGYISPGTAYTDSGSFVSTFTAGTKAQTCHIVGYVGDTLGFYISDSVSCDLVPGEPDSIYMAASIGTLPADSFSVDTIRAYVFDRFGNPVRGGIEVTFSTSRGEVFPVSDETNSAGVVEVYLRSSFDHGVARVVGRSGIARGEVDVVFTPTNVFTVALMVDDVVMQADGYSETTCRASVLDSLGNPVSDGTPVIFSMWPDTIWDTLLTPSDTLGSLIPTIAYTTTGIAETQFRVTTKRGRVWIQASVDTISDAVFIQILPGVLSFIDIQSNPDTIAANGRDESQITATLYDDFGNRLLSGESVSFGTDLGTIAPSNTMTNSAGDAFSMLTAGTEPGIARVWAQSSGKFELTQVTFRKSDVGALLLTADPVELVADGMSQSIITCQVFDWEGSPITDGTRVNFRVRPADTAGTVVSPKLTFGGSCVTIFTASTQVGTGEAWIIGEVFDTMAVPPDTLIDSVRIFVKPGPATTINVWSDTAHTPTDTIWADGADDIFIYAEVLDQYGNHLEAGENVRFETSLGTITPTAITDTSGIAKSLLVAGLEPGNAVILAYCGEAMGYGEINLQATTVDNVLLVADSSELVANGTSTTKLYAYVYSAGGHLVSNNTQVRFEVPSGLALPLPADAYTDSGVATTVLKADTVATPGIEIWAIAGSDTGRTTIRLNPGPASRIVAYAIPGTLYADGASVAAIACTVYDRYPNPVAPATPVSFETTLGSIIPTGYTNTSGYAFTRLTASTESGHALVTIRCGEAIEFVDVFFDSLTAAEIIVNVIPTILPGDGTSTADITAYVYDAGGLPVSDNTRVTFTQDTTGGRPTGIITPRIAFTSGGQATAILTAPVDVGQGLIIGTVGATVVDSAMVTYIPGEPATIEFDTTYADTLPADGAGYDVVVRVYDAYHNPVNIGTEVTFETSRGEIISPSVVDSDSGTARTLLSSMETGPAFVTARSGVAVGSRPYYFYALTADVIDLVANPIRILADGSSTSNLLASVLDTTGGIRPVSDNTPVFFESRGGGIVTPRTAYTVDGQVTAQLIAGITTGPDTIIASVSPTVADTAVVDFIPGPPAIVAFVPPIRDMYADGADTQTVWVEVTDAFGNPVTPGLPISYDITIGYVTPASATNDSGFSYTVVIAETDFGTASLSARCSGVTGYATLNFLPLLAESLLLVVNPPQLTANGVETANLTAVVWDSTGLPVSDGTMVRFGTSDGIISPAVAYTLGGVATSSLIAGTTPADTVYVTASAGGTAIDTAYARFVPGPPSVMYISASDTVISANSADICTIFVEVYDEYGNPVSPGEEVTFSATLGDIVTTAYTDSSGRASVRLVSGSVSGFSNVTATSGDAHANILIEFTSTEVKEVNLTVVPTILTADGASTADVIVYVLDTTDNPVSDGTTVRFSDLSLGNVSPVFTTTTDGEANATITAYTSVGWDSLVATCGDSTDTVAILFESGPPAYVWLTPGRTTLMADETDTTMIHGEITDAFGNKVGAGHAVNFSIDPPDYGTIWSVAATDDSGWVDVPFRAGRYAGVAIVRANCEGAEGVTQIQLDPTDVGEVILSITPRYMPADGVTFADITAFVADTLGMPIADGTIVRFGQDTTLGSVEGLLNPNRETTTDGGATVHLFTPTVTGSTFVYAYVDTIYSDTISVYFLPGDIAVVRFDTNFVQLYADGVDTLADSVWVEDAFGNGIPGEAITFTLDLGSVTPPMAVTGPLGGVPFKVTSPTRIGSSYLQATSGGVNGYLPIDYLATTVDTIIISISPRGLPADGISTADVHVTVLDSLGNPVSDGVTVRFTAQMGLITPVDSLLSGVAEAILVAADTSGVDTIRAICQSETAFVTITYEAGSPDEITLTVVPDTATVGSSITSIVSGYVTDAADNPVAPGTYVYLSVDSVGTGSVADPIVATDDSGFYATLYTPGLNAGLTGITATVDGLSEHANILLYAGPPHTMDIAVSRDFIYIRGVGEIDQAVIEAVIYDEYDNPVRDSCAVVFRIVDYPTGGSINPELIPGGALVSDTVYTMAGRASVAARSGDRSGSMVVEAVAYIPGGGSIDSRAPRITIGSGLPFNVSVSREDCNVRGWDIDGVSNSIMAIVTDTFENPVAPGTAVWFTALQGAITTSSVTDDSGFAFATWYSADPRGTTGIVTIIAETRDTSGVRADTVYFYNSGPADSMAISISPAVVYADATGTAEIQVSIWDVNRNPVTDGTSVNLITDWGSVTSPVTSVNECYSSYAVSTYTGANVFRDDYCGQDTAKAVNVTANIGGVVTSGTVYLKHDLPSSSNSTINAPSSVPYTCDFITSVRIVDQWDNPICGEDITLSGANVTIVTANPQTTGNTGEASWTCTAADTGGASIGVLMATINSTGGMLTTQVGYARRRPGRPPEEDIEGIPETVIEAPRTEFYIKEEQ